MKFNLRKNANTGIVFGIILVFLALIGFTTVMSSIVGNILVTAVSARSNLSVI